MHIAAVLFKKSFLFSQFLRVIFPEDGDTRLYRLQHALRGLIL